VEAAPAIQQNQNQPLDSEPQQSPMEATRTNRPKSSREGIKGSSPCRARGTPSGAASGSPSPPWQNPTTAYTATAPAETLK